MASDFEVSIDCGGGQLLGFRIMEQELLSARDPQKPSDWTLRGVVCRP